MYAYTYEDEFYERQEYCDERQPRFEDRVSANLRSRQRKIPTLEDTDDPDTYLAWE